MALIQTDTFSKIPAFPIPEGFSDDYTYLESLVRKGAKERWPTGISGDVARRIAYELRAIKSAGAAGYFLIVHDYVTAARAMGVRVGPGREGGGGSVVAYCLKITSVDPVAFGMLSELFISPLKRTTPDLNVDFADSDLDRIRALLVAKYGYRHVARISIPGYDANGTERGRALHACALLISRDDLVKSFPVVLTTNEKMLVVPAALPALRSCGYRIFNLMGFRVLTEMRMLAQIRREHGVELNLEALPLDDKGTYRLFATGATDSIYQFKTAAMKEWLREVQPSCFEELTAVYALSAPQTKRGVFEQADGGTLFLDEIGELPLEAQGTLLRVLEGGRFTRVGDQEEVEVDVRLVAATNRDLPALIREGRFREDLFFRLNVVQLRIPPLRERKDDIAPIADNYWMRRHRSRLRKEQHEALVTYDYPGNVRELYNLLERATVLKQHDFTALLAEQKEMLGNVPLKPAIEEMPDELEAAVRLLTKRIFKKHGGNITKTAEAMKVAKNTVRKHLGLLQ